MSETRFCSIIGDVCAEPHCIHPETNTTCNAAIIVLGRTLAEYAQTHGLDSRQYLTWAKKHQKFSSYLAAAMFTMIPDPAIATGLNVDSTHQAIIEEALKNQYSPPHHNSL